MPEIRTHSTNLAQPETNSIFSSIGVELEYPVAMDTEYEIPVYGHYSGDLRDDYGNGNDWIDLGFPSGYMGRDHTGAEITSDVMDLHTEQPSIWYNRSIQRAESMGYPLSPSGDGDTVFGLHMHISSLTDTMAEQLYDFATQDWASLFFCTSITPTSLDPWRHGGIGVNSFTEGFSSRQSIVYPCSWGSDDGHYEFRLPEPMMPEHFALVMEFFRRFSRDEDITNAADFAYDLVMGHDERITAIAKYKMLEEAEPDFPEEAIHDGRTTREHVAETVHTIMEG